MSIFPLPQFEADLAEYERDRRDYEKLEPPKTIVVRFGRMKLIGEFPYSGKAKPGCGSKIVVRTHRGTEVGEMLTSTCPNAGCSKSVTRKQMLDYIENSGGRDYPFHTDGKALRVATIEDMNEHSRLESISNDMRQRAQSEVVAMGLPMKIVEAEPILGGERLTFYFTAEDRVDFRDLVRRLAEVFSTRIDLRQVGARDEARLVADYERCGQHCCCKQFLKVLKPISMKSAKVQKATLDPLKISGRCGRLMCCLRYEDETYTELQKRLPKMKARVGTIEGVGIVVDRQILTQLVLVQIEETGNRVAVPVEELISPEEALEAIAARKAAAASSARAPRSRDPLRGMSPERAQRAAGRRDGGEGNGGGGNEGGARGGGERRRPLTDAQKTQRKRLENENTTDRAHQPGEAEREGDATQPKKRRRRRRKPREGGGDGGAPRTPQTNRPAGEHPASDGSPSNPERKRRRRRRKPREGGGGGSGEAGGNGGSGGGGGGGE